MRNSEFVKGSVFYYCHVVLVSVLPMQIRCDCCNIFHEIANSAWILLAVTDKNVSFFICGHVFKVNTTWANACIAANVLVRL